MVGTNSRAQMHVLEVMLTAVLFTSAMNVAVDVLPTANQDASGPIQLELLGRDALEVADGLVPANSSEAALYGNSTLKLWLMESRLDNLSAYLNATLLPSVAYELVFTLDGEFRSSLDHSTRLGEVVIVERMLSHQGEVYRTQLFLWYGPRGGGG